MNASGLVVRTWNDAPISRRDSDGYADATAMCHANGKEWSNYRQNDRTTAYLQALSTSLSIPTDELVLTSTSGPNHLRGTWIHPRLAVDLARWLSPEFAVWMDGWFLEAAGQAHDATPAAKPEDFRNMLFDEWMDQPIRIRQAQRCLLYEEMRAAGHPIHSNVSVGQWFANNPPINQIQQETAKQISHLVVKQLAKATVTPAPTQLEDLTPLQEWIIEAIHCRRSQGLTATTKDLASLPGCEWCQSSISNRLTLLRRQGLVVKRHRGWHLSAAAERMLDAAAA